MNIDKLLNDEDYFNDWFIENNLESLVKLAKLQGYLHHLSIFFEEQNI
jgi:hypothetical protein